ncbi:MAG: BrnT family toxin [Deltaproteobacteria bacterium]|nr:BrnT family toxin [Deltaproteobacteria bacterium]
MKYYVWDSEKNLKLNRERGITFDEVVFHIENGHVLDIVEHHNPKYEGQKIYVIRIDDYAYLVPFEEKEDEIILKTIIPSRKATKIYISEGDKDEKSQT